MSAVYTGHCPTPQAGAGQRRASDSLVMRFNEMRLLTAMLLHSPVLLHSVVHLGDMVWKLPLSAAEELPTVCRLCCGYCRYFG